MDRVSIGVDDKVRMLSGAFAEFVDSVETISKSDRLRILFDFMGQKSHLDILQQNLEKL